MEIKIVLHKNYGRFNLSEAAKEELGLNHSGRSMDRTNTELIRVVEKLGDKAGSGLKVVTVKVLFEIEEHDGFERCHVNGYET